MNDHEHDFWATPFGPMKCANCPATRPVVSDETPDDDTKEND